MAKLSGEVLEEGRKKITDSDLEGLMRWIETNTPGVFDEDSLRSMRKTFGMTFLIPDAPKAMKLFNHTFNDMDPQAEVLVMRIRIAAILGVVSWLMVLGILGGVFYLFRTLFGL